MAVTKQVLENFSFVDSLSLTYLLGSNFTIVDGDSALFKLETGLLGGVNLVFRDAPDFESPFGGGDNSYSFTVRYNFLFGTTKNDTYTVHVNDVNEAPTGMSATIENVNENTIERTKVAHVDVTDPDTKDAFKEYDYTLLSFDSRFEMDSNGDVYLKANKSLDFESGPICLTVLATDKTFPLYSTIKTFTLDIGDVDEAPTALTLCDIVESVDENTSDEIQIATLKVTDPDTTSEFRDYVFTVTKTSDGSVAERFFADETGVYLKADASLDYESEPTIDLTVTVTSANGEGEPVSQTLTFAVNDMNERPTALNVSDVAPLAENTKTEKVLATVAVTDADTSEDFTTYTYTILTTPADPHSVDDRFVVNENGELVLLADKDINFEAGSPILVIVRATDANDPKFWIDEPVWIAVADVNELPEYFEIFRPRGEGGSEVPLPITFAENTSLKTELANVDIFGDPDGPEEFRDYTYTFTSGRFPNNTEERFTIEGGKLYLKAGQSTDHESEGTIDLTVTLHDGELTKTKTVEIIVTDVDESGGDGGTGIPGPNIPTPTPNDGFDGSVPALVVSSFVEGVIPGTLARLESLSNFAEEQFLAYQAKGVLNPELGPYEALGLGFSVTTEFQDKYGALTEPAFILEAYENVFGREATGAQADHFQAQIDYFEALYASANIPEARAEMMAKGAALGQMLGFAVLSEADTQPYLAQAQAFLADAADGVVEMGKPLAFYELN